MSIRTYQDNDWEVILIKDRKQIDELLKVAQCPNSQCDNGHIPVRQNDPDGDWDWGQCQWCAERDAVVGKEPEKKPDEMVNGMLSKLSSGLYRVHWKPDACGGSSLVAIGCTESGEKWIAPTNWVSVGMLRDHIADILEAEKIE